MSPEKIQIKDGDITIDSPMGGARLTINLKNPAARTTVNLSRREIIRCALALLKTVQN